MRKKPASHRGAVISPRSHQSVAVSVLRHISEVKVFQRASVNVDRCEGGVNIWRLFFTFQMDCPDLSALHQLSPFYAGTGKLFIIYLNHAEYIFSARTFSKN